MDSGESTSRSYYGRTRGRLYDFYLNGSIGSPDEYTEWFQEIRSASENDIVIIHINSMGGDLLTAIQFMRVFQETRATIVCSVEGACFSAATVIFLAARQFEVSNHSIFMFHNYSSFVDGKGGELYDHVMHGQKWSSNLWHSVYKDFFNDEEIKQMIDGKDFWMDGEEVIKRLKKRVAANKPKKPKRPKKIAVPTAEPVNEPELLNEGK